MNWGAAIQQKPCLLGTSTAGQLIWAIGKESGSAAAQRGRMGATLFIHFKTKKIIL